MTDDQRSAWEVLADDAHYYREIVQPVMTELSKRELLRPVALHQPPPWYVRLWRWLRGRR